MNAEPQPRRRPAATPVRIQNALTIDVEDWVQSVLDPDLPLTDHFRANTHAVLATLAAHNVRATFFVLGLAAEKAPQLVREIQAAGHEVQSHGYGHRLVFRLTPQEFRADLEHSKKLLEDLTGQPVTAYRAPAFSITMANLWALDVLAEAGYIRDSSIFPVRTPRYGIAGAPRYPHRLRTPGGHELFEWPVASYRVLRRTIPVGGGGYFRLFPYPVIRRAVRQINQAGQPALIYLHPHEWDPTAFRELDHPVSWKLRLHQGLWRRGLPRKVDRLMTEFRFDTMQAAIEALQIVPRHEYRATSAEWAPIKPRR